MTFDEVLAGAGSAWEVTPDWGQGRATYGGLLAAIGLAALRKQVPAERALRSVTCTFVAPCPPGPVAVDVAVLRAGGAVTVAEARLGTAVVMTAAFGSAREPALALEGPEPPPAPPPDVLPPLRYVEGVFPAFTQHFDLRFAVGLPFQGAPTREVGGWIRHRAAAQPGSELAVLGMLDGWPAPVLARMSAPAPASSITWTAHLVRPLPVPGQGWFRFHARTDHASGGYCDMHGTLWAADGRPVATTHQVIAYYG